MLFVQKITIRYYKDARTPQCAAKRRSVRFCPLPKDHKPEGEVLLHDVFMGQDAGRLWTNSGTVRCYGEEAFYGGGFNNTPFSGRLAVTKEDDTYRIGYCDKRNLGFFTTRMLLRPGEYGRVIYNERDAFDYTEFRQCRTGGLPGKAVLSENAGSSVPGPAMAAVQRLIIEKRKI